MGNVILDGKILDTSFDEPSLLEVVAAVERDYVEEGWIIIEVQINGTNISDFTHEDGTLISYDPEAETSVTTKKLHDILLASVEEFEKYLVRLIPGLKNIATLYRQGMEQEANQHYIEAIDGIRVMIELIQGLSTSKALDFNSAIYGDKSLMDLTERLKLSVQRLVEAQANEDTDRLAELLDTDISEELMLWGDVMPILHKELLEAE